MAGNAFTANTNITGNAVIHNTQNAPGPPNKDPKVIHISNENQCRYLSIMFYFFFLIS